MVKSKYFSLIGLSVPLAALLAGCNQDSDANYRPESSPEAGYFESSATGSYYFGAAAGASGSYTSATVRGGPGGLAAPTAGEAAPTAGAGDAQRAIAEADIIQLQGTKLYAMSRTGGLSIIDVSQPRALKILGHYRTSFMPFEMYVTGGVVFAMYSDWGQFVQDANGNYLWAQTSTLLALDVSNPQEIKKLAQFDIPGELSDSRLVGDVLYAVSYQNGSCWGCGQKPTTNIVSINVAKPSSPFKVDELSFENQAADYGWGKRSISVTEQRIYVAGPEYGSAQPENSTIQVVDISDAKGDLVAGTTIKLRGQITSRWQMDEYKGTLRVISQPWAWWNNNVPPTLETFTVISSQQITKLAHLDLRLPRPEVLESVRFDGERGYAVTFERTDPLFTFDLSNPAAPKQLGELEMPGFLYHMEPRGNRLIGLGYDQGNPEGAITVSIFDVTNLATPTMLKRVNFGGTWGQLPEDQDRIHKAFKLDPDNGLILVPFSGYQADKDGSWCGTALNGVQIIDWAGDALRLRGQTRSLGQARRAFVANNALFTVAEQEVAAYDISNRDAPTQLSAAPLALNVSLTLPTGEQLVRLRQDWYSADMRLEVVPKTAAGAFVATTTFNLTDYLRKEHGLGSCSYWYPANDPLFAVGETVWALINDYGQWDPVLSQQKGQALLVGFSSRTGKVTGSLALPFQPGYWGFSDTSRVVKGSVAFLMQEGWTEAGSTRNLAVLDLSAPEKPRLAYRLSLPSSNGYYDGAVGLLESGNELVTGYAEAVPGKENVVRHFALRIDVSTPLSPRLIGAFNIPGYLVDFDAARNTAVALDHRPVSFGAPSHEACHRQLPSGWFDDTRKLCQGYAAFLHRLELDETKVRITQSLRKDELGWSTPRRGQARLFFPSSYYYGYAATGPAYYYGGWAWDSQRVTVVDSTTLAFSTLDVPGVWNSLPMGQSLILAPSAGQPLSVIDASDVANVVTRSTKETALGYTSHMSVSGEDVFLSQGEGGVQHMVLP